MNIAVATESALTRHFADMADLGTTEKSALNGLVLVTKFPDDGNELVCLILYSRMSCEFPIRCNLGLFGGAAPSLQHLL